MVCGGFALEKLHIQVLPGLVSEDCEVHGPQSIPWSPHSSRFSSDTEHSPCSFR